MKLYVNIQVMPVFISYPLEASTEKYFLLGVILV